MAVKAESKRHFYSVSLKEDDLVKIKELRESGFNISALFRMAVEEKFAGLAKSK